eukprot:1947970-Alexandrium_andersonii.AAC.1
MSASLVGSEMCIRDRRSTMGSGDGCLRAGTCTRVRSKLSPDSVNSGRTCLLYTSDAADDM